MGRDRDKREAWGEAAHQGPHASTEASTQAQSSTTERHKPCQETRVWEGREGKGVEWYTVVVVAVLVDWWVGGSVGGLVGWLVGLAASPAAAVVVAAARSVSVVMVVVGAVLWFLCGAVGGGDFPAHAPARTRTAAG